MSHSLSVENIEAHGNELVIPLDALRKMMGIAQPVQTVIYCGPSETAPVYRCPVCGTNPGRCARALDETDKTCFLCGRAVVEA